MTRPLATVLAAAGLLILSAAPALAGPLWTADWSAIKPNILAPGGNQVLLSDEGVYSGNGTENILATSITVALPFTGDSDSLVHQNYSLQLVLKDTNSGNTATMTFSGDLDGTFSASSSSITNTFDSANTMHEADLGGNHYTVTVGPYEADGQGANVGKIRATIAVAMPEEPPTEPVPTPNDAPEPTTLVLAGMGAALSGLRWLRQRPS